MAKTDKDEWVLNVLGIDMELAGVDHGGKLAPIWTDAKERLDNSLEQLQRALKAVDDPDAQQLAEYGLNGITDRASVKLMAALLDADNGGDTAKLQVAIAGFRQFLDGAAIVDLLENNELGIKVPIRTQLEPALNVIEARIAA